MLRQIAKVHENRVNLVIGYAVAIVLYLEHEVKVAKRFILGSKTWWKNVFGLKKETVDLHCVIDRSILFFSSLIINFILMQNFQVNLNFLALAAEFKRVAQ